jgi:RimJ/RimL family protein N-acetyltransferase
MVSIKTERLLLREFVDSDLPAVHEYAQDKETTKFLDWGPNSLRETTVFLTESVGFQQEQPRNTFDLAVTVSATTKLIGGCSVAILDHDKRIAGLGYILNRSAWGIGYASEAAQALLQLAFDDLTMQKVMASCDSENKGSENVMIKLGMLKEAHLKRDKFMKGKYRDTLVYSITRSDWHSRNHR